MATSVAPPIRRIGALSLVLGLVLSFTAIAVGAPAGAAASSNICNNQQPGRANCQGAEFHGTLTAEVQANGDLEFTIVGNSGFIGWNEIKICIPQVGPTQGADCTGSDPEIVSPTQYELSGVSGAQEFAKNVTFDCDTNFSALVDKSAFPAGTRPTYTVHLSPCNGGTDEAFGTADTFMATTTTSTSTSTTSTTAPTTTSSTSTSTTSTSTSTTTAPTTTSTTSAPTTTTTTAPTTTTLAPTTTSTSTTSTTAPTTTTSTSGVLPATIDRSTTTSAPSGSITTPTPGGGAGTTGAAVLGAVLSREAASPAGSQVGSATLPRTGFASPILLAVGVGLMLLGYLAVTIGGRRALQPAFLSPSAPIPPATFDGGDSRSRPMMILAGLLAAGTALGKVRR